MKIPGSLRGKADPAMYDNLRARALRTDFPEFAPEAVRAVLMDWHVPNGTVSVLAVADGTASVYLSNGGGFLGGGQRSGAIHEAALRAVAQATGLRQHFAPAGEETGLPSPGRVRFLLPTGLGVLWAEADETALKSGRDPLTRLGAAMQRIVTEYRMLGS